LQNVTTAIANDSTGRLMGGRNHFLLRRLHSLTGILFGGYLLVHLLVNATIAQGTLAGSAIAVYQAQVNKIHELPLLWAVEWAFIFLPILFHAVYGIWITVTGQPNVGRYPYGKNWYYLLQRVSAVILVLFLAFHILSLKYGLLGGKLAFDPHQATATIGRHMNVSSLVTWVVYPLGIFAGCFHMANGFWTGGITWGLTVSAGAQRRWGLACFGSFALTMVLGLTALFASVRIGTPALGH
jgi:succinate dehydrogenase / fumarate reductase cytochrome b subunit